MLTKKQMEKYADVLIWGLKTARSKNFKPYDSIMLRFDTPAIELAEVLHRKLVEERMNIIMRLLQTPTMEKNYFDLSDSRQRKFVGKWDYTMMENLNGNILLSAPESLTHLKDVDPKKINEAMIARKKLRKVMEAREEKGLLGWTLCTWPTSELAKQAKTDIKKYTAQIIKACFLNEKDPVAKWQDIYEKSNEIKKWLKSLKIDTFHMESKSCDLKIKLGEKRKFLGVSGHNIPSFEIFTSPDWRGTEGIYFADQPSFRSGNYVEGVRLEFKKGNVINASAKKGEKFLKQMVAMDPGSKRAGEYSLTDKRFSKIDMFMADTLFDENFGGKNGNSHLAIGMSYSDTFDGNTAGLTKEKKKELGYNDSALHWDLVNTEDKTVKAITKNGKTMTIYEKGMFTY